MWGRSGEGAAGLSVGRWGGEGACGLVGGVKGVLGVLVWDVGLSRWGVAWSLGRQGGV